MYIFDTQFFFHSFFSKLLLSFKATLHPTHHATTPAKEFLVPGGSPAPPQNKTVLLPVYIVKYARYIEKG